MFTSGFIGKVFQSVKLPLIARRILGDMTEHPGRCSNRRDDFGSLTASQSGPRSRTGTFRPDSKARLSEAGGAARHIQTQRMT